MDVISRAKAICLTPKTEWPVISEESTSTGTLITGYVLPLAAIGAVAGFIGRSFIGISMPFVGNYRVPLATGLTMAVVGLVLAIVSVVLVGMIVNALAPTFGGQKDSSQALKVVAYSYTPAWIAGVLQIVPMLGILGILAALYGIYLLYLGLPRLMKSPEDKAIGYTVVTIICAVVLGIVLSAISAAVVGAGAIGAGMMGGGPAVTTPAAVDADSPLGRLEQLGTQLEESANRAEAAAASGDSAGAAAAAMEGLGALFGGGRAVEALAIDRLEPFAPETFGGLPVVDRSAERNGMGGMMVTTVEAVYGNGGARDVELEIVDSGGMSGLAGLAGWAGGFQGEQRDSSGSERTYRENGRLIHERVSTTGGSNEFGVMVGDRFMVSASSQTLGLDALKAAVAALDLAGLEALKDEGVQQ